jgi:hypothetical protein
MTGESMIDYEALAQEAMRNVVRSVLSETAAKGLPGDHHFYISFDTLAPGVVLSKRLREKYAEEMTIVLQHRFWDLFVNENRFEVKLTFDGIPERLVVPFKAIRVFFDPSVRYGLQFETQPLAGVEVDANDELIASDFDDPFAHREFESSGSGGDGENREIGPRPATALAQRRSRSSIGQKDRDAGSESLPDAELEVDDDRAAQRSDGAEIVSLDAFRKK